MLDILIKLGAGIGALVAMGGVATYLDAVPVLTKDLHPLEQQVAQENQAVILLQWQMLDAKLQQNRSLDFNELQQYCSLSKQLGFIHIPVCGT